MDGHVTPVQTAQVHRHFFRQHPTHPRARKPYWPWNRIPDDNILGTKHLDPDAYELVDKSVPVQDRIEEWYRTNRERPHHLQSMEDHKLVLKYPLADSRYTKDPFVKPNTPPVAEPRPPTSAIRRQSAPSKTSRHGTFRLPTTLVSPPGAHASASGGGTRRSTRKRSIMASSPIQKSHAIAAHASMAVDKAFASRRATELAHSSSRPASPVASSWTYANRPLAFAPYQELLRLPEGTHLTREEANRWISGRTINPLLDDMYNNLHNSIIESIPSRREFANYLIARASHGERQAGTENLHNLAFRYPTVPRPDPVVLSSLEDVCTYCMVPGTEMSQKVSTKYSFSEYLLLRDFN